jgi:ABC-type glycerol-3-phosphate transport system substrate-binding protein
MRSIAPFAIALCLGLAGCLGNSGTTASSSQQTLADVRTVCTLSGQATTVRYKTRSAAYSEQAVQLLNGFDGGATARDCPAAVPMASVVTLRYRIAGS